MALPLEEDRGDPYLRLLASAHSNQRAATLRILETHRGSASFRLLMRDAQARGRRYAEAALRISPPEEPLACGKSCYHCCWATVGVVAPEALHLAGELRDKLSPDELAALTKRAMRLGGHLRRMDRGERLDARLPCALLLREGSCSAYRGRPLVCRWACSPGLQACLDLLVHRTSGFLWMEEVRYQPMQEVWRGLRAGLLDLELDGSLISLNGALAIALADPEATARYLRGEPVFEEALLER